MDKKKIEQIDKGVYIALMVLAAIAILVAMVTGPMGLESVAITASVCACVITGMVLLRTIRALHSPNSRK